MKKASILLILLSFCLLGYSQTKKPLIDKIFLRDYNVLEVEITKISEHQIEYTFPAEKLINVLETSRVAKIQFSNGRVQSFLEVKPEKEIPAVVTEAEATKDLVKVEMKQNMVAILPIPFLNTETLASSGEMAKLAQNDMYNNLVQNSSSIFPLQPQDLRITNNLLKKAGIDYTNIDEILIEDLHKILGVDHVVAAKVSYVLTIDQSTTSLASTDIKKKNDSKTHIDEFNTSTSTTEKKFDFTVYFDIYKNNSKIYSQKRVPFFTFKDSWIDSMQYLLKRSPIYVKK
jgi:hypothetical protein